jgi:fatty acid-binding protein DegV
MLNVNPVIKIDESGKAVIAGKAFNERASREKVMDSIRKAGGDKKIWNYIILHANYPEAADWYSARMKKLTGMDPVSVLNISPVLGAHAGQGAAAVAMLTE